MTQAERIAVKEIVITRVEGDTRLCDKPQIFDSFESAHQWLVSQSYSFPDDGSYDKHDFKIVWVDGRIYNGRLDCMDILCKDNDLDIAEHVRKFCIYMSGRGGSIHGTDSYKRELEVMALRHGKSFGIEHALILDKYLPEN